MNRISDLHNDALSGRFSVKGHSSDLVNNRKEYAKIDIESMGVNLNEYFTPPNKLALHLKLQPSYQPDINKNSTIDSFANTTSNCIPDNMKSDLIYSLTKQKYHDHNAKYIANALTEKERKNMNDYDKNHTNFEGIKGKIEGKDLPQGWERHEDNDGPYYWHIKSGTIQREAPILNKYNNGDDEKEICSPLYESVSSPTTKNNKNISHNLNKCRMDEYERYFMTRSKTIPALNQGQKNSSRESLRKNGLVKSEPGRSVRFTVRSLGWVKIAEEDLVPERSSKAVNKCIIDLSLGRNDLLDVVGRWGDGKNMYLYLEEGSLKLVDAESLTVLNCQPIHTIRVWGVGRDNGRDFAYVSRDRLTRIHMCHVFRCDTAARTIANTLRDICKQIMIERSLQLDTNTATNNLKNSYETNQSTPLDGETNSFKHSQFFPTPMEEPKKILKALYMGFKEVSQSTGIDVINEAINSVIAETTPDDWINVSVAIAPSMISIRNTKDHDKLIAECRVRYLSFLGIGKNFKKCAFIVHTARNKFVAHVFHCEPSSGALCKTVEAACKLRYQKCLDAHPDGKCASNGNIAGKGIGAAIKDMIHSLSFKKDKCGS